MYCLLDIHSENSGLHCPLNDECMDTVDVAGHGIQCKQAYSMVR